MPIRRGWTGDYYERAGIFIPNALGRFLDGPGGCLIGLIILAAIFMFFLFVMLKISYGITSVIMPSETLMDTRIYRNSIEDRTEIFTDKILEQQAQEMFKLNELYQRGYRIEVSIRRPYSNKLREHNVEDFNIWYKSPELSVVQTVREVTSSVYYGDKRAFYTDSNEQIEFTHIAYIRSQMKVKRNGLWVEYEFTPEKIQYLE